MKKAFGRFFGKIRHSNRPYFVIGCHRSGTTSIARIFDEAENGVCYVEPVPNLNCEARERMDGQLGEATGIVQAAIEPRISACDTTVYGEKNAPLGMFTKELLQLCDCRFIFVVRDGRDVVRSLINWHEGLFGSIYRECKETSNLTEQAKAAVANLPVELDYSDYFRPRPLPGEPLFEQWENLSRMEMCAFFWSRYNDYVLDALSGLPDECYRIVDYSIPSPVEIMEAARFVGLEGVEATKVRSMLDKKINSLKDRTGFIGGYPHWHDWDDEQMGKFMTIAGSTMKRLGYV